MFTTKHFLAAIVLSIVGIASSGFSVLQAQTLKLHYDFSSTKDATGTYIGTLQNGAVLNTYEGQPILSLGANNGYFDFGQGIGSVLSTLTNFTISTNLYLPSSGTYSSNGNFVYCFSNASNILADPSGYLFFGSPTARVALTQTYYNAESSTNTKAALPQGEWKNFTYVQQNEIGTIYINGVQAAQNTSVTLSLADLGSTSYNWLGRSCYSGDAYLANAEYNDFRVYDGTLTKNAITDLCAGLSTLNASIYQDQLSKAATSLLSDISTTQRSSITLPTSLTNDITVSWATSDAAHLATDGTVTRPNATESNAAVTLTATLKKGSATLTKDFQFTILALTDATASIALDLDGITFSKTPQFEEFTLPTEGTEGSIITWESKDLSYVNNAGKVLQLAAYNQGPKAVTLTATATLSGTQKSRDYTVYVGADQGYFCYLFAYFTGNNPSQEQIRFAVSRDGYNYTPLNNGNPVVGSDTIARTGCVRDPHILRGKDGKFYMVVTDMKSSLGWSSNDGLVLLKSNDLINWTHTYIDFPTAFPTRFNRTDLTQVWAPQTIWDPDAQKYMVYYSIGESINGVTQYYKIYYSYVNDDFTGLTEPEVLYDHGSNTIDGDIVYDESDSLYHIFFKTEGNGNGIQQSTSPSLKGSWTDEGKYLQQTTVAVEGSGVFPLINSNNWVLMYDCYTSGYYQFCTSADLHNFSWVQNTSNTGSFAPRHGTVIPITSAEAKSLGEKWPTTGLNWTGISEVTSDSETLGEIAKTEYYSLQGTIVATDETHLLSGIYLKKSTYENGQVRTTKIAIAK